MNTSPHSKTVNQHYYVQILRRLRLAVCRQVAKETGISRGGSTHHNAPVHTAHSVQVS
jgi:hypothetical protein